MLVNVTLLNQSIQVILVFDILMDLFLLLLVYLQFYSSMNDRLSFYFKQHKHLLNNFGLHLKVFMILTVYMVLCLANKCFVDTAYKRLISGKYLIKS